MRTTCGRVAWRSVLGGVKTLCLESDKGMTPSIAPGMPSPIPSGGPAGDDESRVMIVGGMLVGGQKRHGSCGPCGYGRGAPELCVAYATPVPPYSPYRNATHNSGAPRPYPHGPQDPCRFCPPTNIPPTIITRDSSSPAGPPEGIGDGIPGAIDGVIPLSDSRQRVLTPPNTERQATRPQVVRMTHLDPAMLIHRVEPVYPPLAKQTHREGRVQLRAIIGTDGTVRSLEIVAGDPLLERSAVEAVQQWRYKPTILNGQAVEIDTYITVIYTMQH